MNESTATPTEDVTFYETSRLEDCIDTLFAELPGTYDEDTADTSFEFTPRDEALFERERAILIIAGKLADPDTGEATAQRILERHESGEESATRTLYTYWKVMQRLNKDHREAKIPEVFLYFLLDLTKEVGEEDIIPDIDKALLKSMLIQSQGEEEPTEDAERSFDPELSHVNQLRDLSDKAQDDFIADITYNHNRFMGLSNKILSEAEKGGPDQSEEYRRFIRRVSVIDLDEIDSTILEEVAEDIRLGDFANLEEKRRAGILHDDLRLGYRFGDVEGLLSDVQAGKFKSWEGLDLAMMVNDELRLQRNLDLILTDIRMERFLTRPGLEVARRLYDYKRLQSIQENAQELFEDIVAKKFTTRAGLIAAKRQQDKIRIASYKKDPDLMQTHLEEGIFLIFTPEGMTEIQEMIGVGKQ